MIESQKSEKIKRCKCNSSKCNINKGVYITEKQENSQEDKRKQHKYRCCRLCSLKYMRESETKNTGEIKESECKEESYKKMETKSKDKKKSKSKLSEQKGSIVQDLSKKGIISKNLWNYSTRITKPVTYKTEELPIKKQNAKRIQSTTKLPTARCTTIKKENLTKPKAETVEKKALTKVRSKTKEEIKEASKNTEKCTPEPIYISYSLKGFIKLKSRRDIVVCDKYYDECIDTSDEMCCECSCCENKGIKYENECGCCEQIKKFNSKMNGVEEKEHLVFYLLF
nr:hypothetical protein MACL_00002327 [Theileria orientalis]